MVKNNAADFACQIYIVQLIVDFEYQNKTTSDQSMHKD